MVYSLESSGYRWHICHGHIHIIDERAVIDEELINNVGYIPSRIPHSDIHFDRLSKTNLQEYIVVEADQLK